MTKLVPMAEFAIINAKKASTAYASPYKRDLGPHSADELADDFLNLHALM